MTSIESEIANAARKAVKPGTDVCVISVLRSPTAYAYELRMASTTHDYFAVHELEKWDQDTIAHAVQMNADAIIRAVERGHAYPLHGERKP